LVADAMREALIRASGELDLTSCFDATSALEAISDPHKHWFRMFLDLDGGLASRTMLALCVALVLWARVFLEVNQIQSILDRSDEVDLLMARLHQTNAELTVANTALDSMRQSARSELETRSMFFASASHDFRQRLHAMKLLSRAAIDDVLATQPAANTPLNRLSDAVADVERYVTELLDFAREDNTTLKPNKATVELQDIFQQLDLAFEDVAAANRVILQIRATGVVLRTDPAMLQRVLETSG
jgi:signal transduction histidine kinase